MTPKQAWEFIVDNADFCDQGPPGQGWRSDKMKEAQRIMEEFIDGWEG